MRTLLLIFSLAYTAIGQTTKCPAPYHVVGTGCYIFPERYSSWIEASVFCQFSGGYLANIESEDEQIALKGYHDANLPTFSFLWIGATDMVSNGTLRWVPSGRTIVYNNWDPGYPELSPAADCVFWRAGHDDWVNEVCCTVYSISPLCEADPL